MAGLIINIFAFLLHITTKSDTIGIKLAIPRQSPNIILICGTTPLALVWFLNIVPYASRVFKPSSSFRPFESIIDITGLPIFNAKS